MKVFGLSFWVELGNGFGKVFRRFPLAVLSAVVCAVAASNLVDYQRHEDVVGFSRLMRLGFASGLGIPTFILTGLMAENSGGKFSLLGIVVSLAGLFFVTFFGLLMPIDDQGVLLNSFWIKFLLLGGIVHLGIADLPFLGTIKTGSSLWEYNKLVLTRFLLSAFYSAVFFVGVVLALVSIDKLFGVDIDEDNYARIWFFCAFVLSTGLFLGGIPEKADRPRLHINYPKWIHFFCKFILLPLVAIYFGILYAYTLKIVVTWTWPNGMVGLPVFILAFIGGLTSLLVWPLARMEPITRWAQSFWRFFYPLLLPLSVLLLFALQQRIDDYGFTEIRYLGLVLACWLLSVCVYYTIRPSSSFKVIPWSLFGIFIFCSIGPISPGRVALNSQWKRLNAIMYQEGLIVDGTLTPNPHEIEHSKYEDLRSVIQYLRKGYGSQVFCSLIENVDVTTRRNNEGKDWLEYAPYLFTQALLDYTGLTTSGGPQYNYYSVQVDPAKATQIAEASNLFVLHGYLGAGQIYGTFTVQGNLLEVVGDQNSSTIIIRDDVGKLARLDFVPWVEERDPASLPSSDRNDQILAPEDLTFEVDLGDLGEIRLVARQLRFNLIDERWSLSEGLFWVLVPAE